MGRWLFDMAPYKLAQEMLILETIRMNPAIATPLDGKHVAITWPSIERWPVT